MGLRESRIINEVHPWLGVRLKWLAEVARIVGSTQVLLSGNRTRQKQQELFVNRGARPVATPGCSQHQYGFAADAAYLPITQVSSKGRALTIGPTETNRLMESAAHHVNLTTVTNDPGHLQIYPGQMFRNWAIARGLCNPEFDAGFRISEVQASNDRYRECLLRALRVTSESKGSIRVSCPAPCGPLFGIPC